MTNDEIKQKLSEIVEWEIPKIEKTEIKSDRRKLTKEDEYQYAHEQEFMDIFEGVNPTVAPKVIRIKIQPVTCDDCGKHCPDGHRKEKKVYEANGNKHWREKCITCGMSQNPFTKQFDLTVAEASSRWANYWRDVKGIYKTPKNAIREDNGIITSYLDPKDKT